jgi:hypothetical protein
MRVIFQKNTGDVAMTTRTMNASVMAAMVIEAQAQWLIKQIDKSDYKGTGRLNEPTVEGFNRIVRIVAWMQDPEFSGDPISEAFDALPEDEQDSLDIKWHNKWLNDLDPRQPNFRAGEPPQREAPLISPTYVRKKDG